jgi:hypothetical protein
MLKLVVVPLVAFLVTARAVAQPAPSNMKFTRVSVKDPGINNIEAVSFLAPVGWKVEGGVQWFHDYSILANLLMRVSDPQSGAAIEFLPMQNFTYIDQPVMPMQRGQNYMGCIVWEPVGDVASFVQTFYVPQTLRHLQGARVAGRQRLDKVAQEVSRQYGGQSQVVAEKVRYQFSHNGLPWEEDVYVTLVFTKWQMGTMWSVYSAYSFRAPQGKLDAMTPLMSTSINTMRLSLDWFAGYMQVQDLFNKRMKQGIVDATNLSRQISANAEHTRQLYADAYRQRQESQDRISDSFGEYIRGVDTYKNPYEDRPVQLPAGYNDAWVNARGEYVLSNEAGYNPNVGDTTEWRRMDRRGEGGR